jgi:predicted transposase YbfD/YdcC
MSKPKFRFRRPDPSEQYVLDHLSVRLVTERGEIERFDQSLVEHHYLHSAALVGEHLRYVVSFKGQWLGLAAWSAAALHIKPRDQFIGWTDEQRRTRLPLLANNARLLVLPECHYPNLVSRFMKIMLARLSADWQERWGHPLAAVETFVDPQLYQGTAYKVSGWSKLGETSGFKRSAVDFYQAHDCPKQVWLRELIKKACVKLRAAQLPREWAAVEAQAPPRCRAKAQEIRSLREQLASVPEFRRRQALGYPLAGMLALIAMAMFSGVVRGPEDLAHYAATLSQGQLRALNFRVNGQTRRVRCPKASCFRQVLACVDEAAVQRALLRWQDQVLGTNQDRTVIVDGKTLRHAGLDVVNAVNGQGRWLGSLIVPEGTNEIPVARTLLGNLDLGAKLTLADAAHTQIQTAKTVLFEGGGDFLMTVKGNQKELHQTLATLLHEQSFPPSADRTDPRLHPRTQPGTPGNPGSDRA